MKLWQLLLLISVGFWLGVASLEFVNRMLGVYCP